MWSWALCIVPLYIERGLCLELTHIIMGLASSKSSELILQFEFESQEAAEGPRRAGIPIWRPSSRRILSCLGEGQLSVLFRLLGDWMRPTHNRKGILFYLVSQFLNVNLIHKHTEILQIVFDQISGHSLAQSSWHTELNIIVHLSNYTQNLESCPGHRISDSAGGDVTAMVSGEELKGWL